MELPVLPEVGCALDGLQKSAILLISLGAEASAGVLKTLSEPEVKRLAAAISRQPQVRPEVARQVLEEFGGLVDTLKGTSQGGVEYATSVLEQALGSKKAKEILEKVEAHAHESGMLERLKQLEPKTLVDFLDHEHPQTVALILARMDAPQAAQVLAGLGAGLQAEVVVRMAQMDLTSPEVLQEIEAVLERRFAAVASQRGAIAGGTKAVAEILNRLDRSTEKQVMALVEEADGGLAQTIRGQMFTFEDIIQIDDRGIQRLLKEIEQRDLVLSLKGATPALSAKIYQNMSERAAGLIKEEISFLGPTRLRDVEEAQRRITEVAHGLEEQGEIIVAGRGGQEDVLV
jgi:flagellar motor switch protein FliG